MFKEFKEMIVELENTSKSNQKKNILKEHCEANPTNKILLKSALEDMVRYNVSSENCKKNKDLNNPVSNNFFEILEMLSSRKVTGFDAIGLLNYFISQNKDYEDIIFRIIDKDLKCGVNASIVNKVFPSLIPEFSVALAKSYDDYEGKIDFFNGEWGSNQKIDGLRCVTIIKDGKATFFTRKGREFTTLNVLKDIIESYSIKDCVLDGELCIVDENGNEDFKEISKLYKRKDFTIPNPKYKIFDVLTIEEFNACEGNVGILERINRINDFGIDEIICKFNSNFEVLTQNIINSKEDFERMVDLSSKNGWEGLMLRNIKAGYEGKRTKNLLKVKKFHDMEFVVKDIEIGRYRIVEDGKEKETITMTNVIVEYKGNPLSIGSGFSLDERKRFYDRPELIIGKEITVRYFEETEDKNGKKSLRFPTVKIIHEGKRDN